MNVVKLNVNVLFNSNICWIDKNLFNICFACNFYSKIIQRNIIDFYLKSCISQLSVHCLKIDWVFLGFLFFKVLHSCNHSLTLYTRTLFFRTCPKEAKRTRREENQWKHQKWISPSTWYLLCNINPVRFLSGNRKFDSGCVARDNCIGIELIFVRSPTKKIWFEA